MKPIVYLGTTSVLVGGLATALMIVGVAAQLIYVCLVALFVDLWACIFAGAAIALYATRAHRVSVEKVVTLTVAHLLKHRGLELIDCGDD